MMSSEPVAALLVQEVNCSVCWLFRFYIIDTMAQVYRLTHGFGSARLTSEHGEDTSVLHGFLSILISILNQSPPPTHMAVVSDVSGATWR